MLRFNYTFGFARCTGQLLCYNYLMEKFKPTNIKGGVDVLPGVQILRNRVMGVLRKHFEAYGYVPIETASLNYLEVLSYKYDEGSEIVKEIYKLRDQGDRDLGLRFDLTVPFAKFIATNRNLKMPFRRYEIGKVWRNGPVKAGRLREFIQCDIDVVGDSSMAVEAEQIALAVACYRELGIEPVVKYGNRKLLIGLIQGAGVSDENFDKVIAIIDRIEKVNRAELLCELGKYMSPAKAEALLESFKNPVKPAEVSEFERYLALNGISDACVFTPQLARGLNVYTGTVWEIFDKAGRITSSIGGGGRYDRIITDWIDNGLEYPAVGMAFGLEPIMALIGAQDGRGEEHTIDMLVIPITVDEKIFKFATAQRESGRRVQIWNGKMQKGMEYANATEIPFTCVIGEKELKSGKVQIKNMQSGKSEEVKL